eukprot:tig00021373_g21076.t1
MPSDVAMEPRPEPGEVAPQPIPRCSPAEVEFLAPLSEGGGSTVFKCRWKGRIVAAKRVKPPARCKHIGFEEAVAEMKTEVLFLSRIHHPHIVGLLATCMEAEEPFILLDLIQGGTLWHELHESGRPRWGLEAALRFGLQLASAMEYLHSLGILHRDIKSQNLLLDEAGDVHLVDFGLARYEARDGKMTDSGA